MADGKNTPANAAESKPQGFFKGVKREYKKISWTSREDVVRQTTAVVAVSVVCGIIIAALDTGFGELMNILTSVGM